MGLRGIAWGTGKGQELGDAKVVGLDVLKANHNGFFLFQEASFHFKADLNVNVLLKKKCKYKERSELF